MRASAAIPTLALVALFALPTALAQAALLEDPEGDLSVLVAGQPVLQGGTAATALSAIDLRALRVAEDPAGFRFEVQVAGLGGDGPRPDWGNLNLQFSVAGADFSVNLYRSSDNAAYFGNLYRREGGDGPLSFVRGLAVERDLDAGLVWTSIPRQDLRGAAGEVPGRGHSLEGLRVQSSANAAATATVMGAPATRVGDFMPEAGGAEGEWPVLFGGGVSEGATLATPQAYRASNGEATTYLYTLTASHDGPEAARFRLSVDGLPQDWNATLPGTLLEIPAGRPVEFPLYLTTTFRHQHGVAESFEVHLHEEGGERWALLELGVDYLSVPQPSGHHPMVWFHSSDFSDTAVVVNSLLGGAGGSLTMNTLENDPADTRQPVLGYSTLGNGQAQFRWSVCLEPQLLLGLDVDQGRSGLLEVPVSSTRPMPGAVLQGRLVHLGPGEPFSSCFPSSYADREQTVLATLSGTPKDIAAGGTAVLSADVVPADADYVAQADGAALVLELLLTAAVPDAWGVGGAQIEPGGWMELPLQEYHDTVQAVVPDEAQAAPGFVDADAPRKESPALAVPIGLAAIVLAVLASRRR